MFIKIEDIFFKFSKKKPPKTLEGIKPTPKELDLSTDESLQNLQKLKFQVEFQQ